MTSHDSLWHRARWELAVMDLPLCDGCGYRLPVSVMELHGACLLCPPCWDEFQMDMAQHEWDPNQREEEPRAG